MLILPQNRPLAEDIVQSAFIRVYEKIHQFDATRPFGPWFFRIVANDATKAVSRHQTFSLDSDSQLSEQPVLDNYTVNWLEEVETRQEIQQSLSRLTAAQRAVIILSYYMGLSEAEIAQQLQCPPGTVKWRLHAARQRLKQMIGIGNT